MPGHLSAAEAPEDLWTCHECGWTYPNHHPSAKHRRNHKKVCGSIPGFTPTTSSRKAAPEPATVIIDDGASSDDASSDDETTRDKIHGKRGHHHTTNKQQTVAGSAGARAAKSLCVTHRSKDPCDEANNVKPAPLTERTFSGQDNRQALQSTGSTPNAAVKPQHVRRPSAHALQGVWVCRHCAWTYPNAHPSAKHRRKHKKRCLALVVTPRHVVGAGGSSDEASSDEENKRGDAAHEKQETHETNISSTTPSLPSGLEAFLGRSDSKRELRELQDTIILLSPKPASRRNSFKSPRVRREGPSGFLSPRGSLKASKAVNNNQAQELLAGTERKPEVVSDQENEDPVVLNLPAATIPTPRSIPSLENVLGASLADGRRSSSDELDFSNSDEETPSSPDSVLQPVHLLLPITTPDEQFTEQPLHHHEAVAAAATAALKLEVETEKNENTNQVGIKQDELKAAPELPPLTREDSPEVDTSESYPAAAEDQKDSYEVSSVNRCEPVDASPGSELQTTVAGPICVAKESEMASGGDMKVNFSVVSSVVVKPAVETAVKVHVESSALDSDYVPEHASPEAIVVGGSWDSASVEFEHHDVQDTKNDQILREKEPVTTTATEKLIEGQSCEELDSNEIGTTDSVVPDSRPELSSTTKSEEHEGKEGDSKLECANPLRETDLQEASDEDGSDEAEESHDVLAADQSTAEASVEVVKEEEERDDCSLSPLILSPNQLPVEVPEEKEEEDRDSKASSFEVLCPDQPEEVTGETEEKEKSGIPSLSSEVPSPDQSKSEDVKKEDKDLFITPEVSSIDQCPPDCTSDVEYKNLSDLSSESSAAAQLSLNISREFLADLEKDLPASNTEGLAPSESLVEANSPSTTLVSALPENTNISFDPLNAAEVQPTFIDTLEFSSELTSIVTLAPTTETLSSIIPPDAVAEGDLTSELSAMEKTEEPLDLEPKLDKTPSTSVGTLNLNFYTLPTKSQVVVTRPVGDEHQQAKQSDQIESRQTVVVEEKTAIDSVAIDSHLSAGKEELPEASHHSGAAEEDCKEVHGYNNVDEESKDIVSDGVDSSQDQDGSAAVPQMTSNPEATSSLDSAGSGKEDQVPVDEIRSDLCVVPDVEQQEVSPVEVSEVNTADQLRKLNEKEAVEGTPTEVVEVLEPSTIDSGVVVAQVIIDKKIDDLEKEVPVVTETKESRELVEKISQEEISDSSSNSSLDDVPLNKSSSPGSSSQVNVTTTEETGAAESEPGEEKEEVALGENEAPNAMTTPQVPEVADNEEAPAKQASLFGSYKEKFNNPQRELDLNLKAKDPQPAMTRQPGSGKRKLLPSLGGTSGDSPVLKNKKQEMRIRTGRGREVQSENEVPYKLTFSRRPTKRAPAESPPLSPQRAGGPASPEGLVKERIETYERLIGKTRTFGPLPAPSPIHHKFSVPSGKPSSPHFRGLTIVTSHQQFDHGQPEASAEEQISAIAAHLHHVEPKDTNKVQDTGSAPEEMLHEGLSHLRHNNDSEQDSSSTEPEDSSSQRISKVPHVLKEAAEHSLSPVFSRLTKAC